MLVVREQRQFVRERVRERGRRKECEKAREDKNV